MAAIRSPGRIQGFAGALAVAAAVVAIAGCGSSSGGRTSTRSTQTAAPRFGGNATVLEAEGGVDSLDPGYWYYQTDYTDLGQTTQRTLYGFGPTDTHRCQTWRRPCRRCRTAAAR